MHVVDYVTYRRGYVTGVLHKVQVKHAECCVYRRARHFWWVVAVVARRVMLLQVHA